MSSNIWKQTNQRWKNGGHIPKVAQLYYDTHFNSKTKQWVHPECEHTYVCISVHALVGGFVFMMVFGFLFWISLYLFCFKLGFFYILYDFSMVCNVGLIFIWWEWCGSSFFDSLASYDVALWLFCLVCYWVFCGHFLHCLTNNNLFFFW